jgi:lysyl-tRNA synthetase, class I
MFWADEMTQEVIAKRHEPYKVHDWWTPSGRAHAGHIRTFLYHQAIYRGLKLHGKEATYYYGFDDMDPVDGLPHDVPAHFEQYMGVPLFIAPSPVEGYASFGDYYASKYLEAMEDLDVHPEVPRTSEMYRNGVFNEAITIALDNADKIRAIYADFGVERPNDWYPFQPMCEQCGKIGTTYTYDWDGENVSYRCLPNLVKWAKGCGYEGKISPYNGTGKMFWKVEWPAKWFIIQNDFEGGGKDHFTKNSSRDVGVRIVREVFESEPPIGYGHDFFLIGGKKMSSSKGTGMTASDAAHILPPHVMRYFVYRTPPRRQIEFSPEGDAIPKIYDDYDRSLMAAHTDPNSDSGRSVIYANQDEKPLPEYVMRFSKVSFLIQMPHIDIHDMAAKEKGAPLTESELCELDIRIEYARRWLETYATEEAKFVLQPKLPPVELSQEQKVYVAHISEKLQAAAWDGASIHTILHDTKNEMGLAPTVAFSALYRIFLHKDNGPQAGWFLAALDKPFVLHRLNEASHG